VKAECRHLLTSQNTISKPPVPTSNLKSIISTSHHLIITTQQHLLNILTQQLPNPATFSIQHLPNPSNSFFFFFSNPNQPIKMVAIKALIALLPFYLAMTAAMPQYPTTGNTTTAEVDMATATTPTAADKAAEWGVEASNGSVSVNFYSDKNPDHSTLINPNTCEGQSEIALMHWRYTCKSYHGFFHPHKCWNRAPSRSRCCPVPTKKSCIKYWPEEGE
jgi:hypothetical protein